MSNSESNADAKTSKNLWCTVFLSDWWSIDCLNITSIVVGANLYVQFAGDIWSHRLVRMTLVSLKMHFASALDFALVKLLLFLSSHGCCKALRSQLTEQNALLVLQNPFQISDRSVDDYVVSPPAKTRRWWGFSKDCEESGNGIMDQVYLVRQNTQVLIKYVTFAY